MLKISITAACTNSVFGDPTPGVAKHCDVQGGNGNFATGAATSASSTDTGNG
jgi:hypothetical protein